MQSRSYSKTVVQVNALDTYKAVFTNMPNYFSKSDFFDSKSEYKCKNTFLWNHISPQNNPLRTWNAIVEAQPKIPRETKILPPELGKQVLND